MKRTILLTLLLMTLISALFTGCGTKYCAVSGCPKETDYSDYCIEHKCLNYDCKNRGAGSYSYCEECIERAINK